MGAPGPHDFAVRERSPLVGQRPHVHRIPASRVVTTAIRPSVRVRDVRIDNAVSTRSRSELFLQTGLDDPNQLESSGEIRLLEQQR